MVALELNEKQVISSMVRKCFMINCLIVIINKNKITFSQETKIDNINWKKLDLVFLSLPDGEAQKIVKSTYKRFKNLFRSSL